MKPLTLSVSVVLLFQRTFHRTECNENAIVQATRSTNFFLWKRHKCPLLLQFDVSVILNGFDEMASTRPYSTDFASKRLM